MVVSIRGLQKETPLGRVYWDWFLFKMQSIRRQSPMLGTMGEGVQIMKINASKYPATHALATALKGHCRKGREEVEPRTRKEGRHGKTRLKGNDGRHVAVTRWDKKTKKRELVFDRHGILMRRAETLRGRRVFYLTKGVRKPEAVTPAFYTLANLERHCRRRGFVYGKKAAKAVAGIGTVG